MSSDALRRLEEWLAGRPLGPEGRLPPERRLAPALGLSRAELRKALAAIDQEGRLVRHVGRGTFLKDPRPARDEAPAGGPAISSAVAGMPGAAGSPASGHVGADTSPAQLVQTRLALEPELARLAALQATATELERLRAAAWDVRAARTWERYDVADRLFHVQVARSTGNPLLVGLFDVVAEVMRGMNWGRLRTRPATPPQDLPALAEHDLIVEAVADRDRDAAAEAMRRHLLVEATTLVQIGG